MRAAGDHATCGQLRFGDDGRPSLESVSTLAVTGEQLALSTPPCARTGAEVRCYPSGRAPSVVAGAFEELGAGTLACGRSGGNVSCWGYVDVPQLLHISGVPHPDATDRPTRIAGITDATALAVGDDHGCALRATGEVACFGDTRSGGVGALRAGCVSSRCSPRSPGSVASWFRSWPSGAAPRVRRAARLASDAARAWRRTLRRSSMRCRHAATERGFGV
ncbi:MAG: hypothetical protein H6719_33205 [Sandaracinaceae bacterium]|nr:hypothetical protein [Sandaracinaceae bacterium]